MRRRARVNEAIAKGSCQRLAFVGAGGNDGATDCTRDVADRPYLYTLARLLRRRFARCLRLLRGPAVIVGWAG